MPNARNIAIATIVGLCTGAIGTVGAQADVGDVDAGEVAVKRPSDSKFGLAVVRTTKGEEIGSRPLARVRGGPRRLWDCHYYDLAEKYGDPEATYQTVLGKGTAAGTLVDGHDYIFECLDVTDPGKPTQVKLEPGTGWRRVTYTARNPGAPLDARPEVVVARSMESRYADGFDEIDRPAIQVNPTEQVIGIPTWFWVTNAQPEYRVPVGGDGLPDAVIIARPRRGSAMIVKPGDDGPDTSCAGFGVPWAASGNINDPQRCAVTYWHLPPPDANGGRGLFTATVTVNYDVTWEAPALGLEGDLPTAFNTNTIDITVKGLQAVGG
jgi:hypothetical protein